MISTPTRTNSNSLAGQFCTSFELDFKTILTHVLGVDEIDHVSKKYPRDAEDWVDGATTCASNDFHVLDINIDFALV